jgi:hypothetical protein
MGVQLTHPSTGKAAPKTTAPKLNPIVNPALTSPMKTPLLFLETSSRTRMMVRVITPALPIPIKTLPAINTLNVWAWEQTSDPSMMKNDTGRTRLRGEKMVDRRPATGAKDEVAMRYEDVNHMASSYAFSSSAMMDWVMVMPDMLEAVSHLSF